MKKVYLYGASGHGKVVAEILEKNKKSIQAVFDDNPACTSLLDYPVPGAFARDSFPQDAQLIITIGNNSVRKKIAQQLSDVPFATAIHPAASISARSTIGAGTVIMAGVSVNSSVVMGQHVILNTNCSIDHDCELGDFVHISPNAALAGNVKIGEGTHVGIGACVIQGMNIGSWAIIGAGTVVITDVPDHAVVVGNPGKIIRYTTTKQA